MKTAYIEADIKQHSFNKLQTGDLVKLQADISPIIYHYGIIDRIGNDLYIFHNQATFKNRLGGGIIREDFKKYALGRKIVEVNQTGLTKNELSGIIEVLKTKKYHFLNNNCEHFINNLRKSKLISPQAGKWALALIIIIGAISILKRK